MARKPRQSPTVAEIKAAVRNRDGCCVECGMTNDQHREHYDRQLDVHRVVPGSVYSMAGCRTYCRGCHGPQPRRKRGQPDYGRGEPCYLVFVRIDPEIGAAFERWIASLDPRPSKKAALETLIEWYLAQKGLWPPPSPEDASEGE